MSSILFTDYILVFLSSNFSNSDIKNWARRLTWKQSTFVTISYGKTSLYNNFLRDDPFLSSVQNEIDLFSFLEQT